MLKPYETTTVSIQIVLLAAQGSAQRTPSAVCTGYGIVPDHITIYAYNESSGQRSAYTLGYH